VKPLNGRELNADDILGSFDRMQNHEKSVFKGYLKDALVDMKKTDNYTIVMTINRPLASWMNRIADGEAAWIGSKEYIDFMGVEYGVDQRSMVGTGPFLAEKGETGSRYTYVKNTQYFEQPYPFLDAWHRLIIPDASAREAAFVTGQIDEFAPTSLDAANRLKERVAKASLNITTLNSGDAGGFTMNMDLPKWQDFKVRQAVSYAVNHGRIINDLWKGQGYYDSCMPVGLGPVALTQEELKKFRVHDPAKAKQLLTEAGFGAANSLTVEMMTFSTQTLHAEVAEAWAADLKAVGINATLRPLQTTQARELVIQGKYDVAMTTHSTSAEPGEAISAFTPGDPTNYMRLNDPKVNEWHKLQEKEFDIAKRRAIIKEFDAYCNANISGIIPMPKRNGFNMQREWLINYGLSDQAGDEPRSKYVWIDKK
jgi:peptide/nickel transport system substrate-binding protein